MEVSKIEMKYIDENAKIWDKRSANEDKWSVAVSIATKAIKL